MKLKWRVLRLAVLSCVLLTSVCAIGNVLTGRSTTDSGEGFTLVKPALAQTTDASFLDEEAGIAAYVNVGSSIDLAKAKAAYRTIEKETAFYIIGSVSLPDYPVSEDIHLYVRQDGWIFAYYMNSEPTSKIVDWLSYSPGKVPTKLELGLQMVANSLGLPATNVKYYHFKYPNANGLIIAAKSCVASGGRIADGSFNLTIPSGLLVNERSWSHYDSRNNNFPQPFTTPITNVGILTISQLKNDVKHQVSIQTNNQPGSDMKIDGMTISTVQWPMYSGVSDQYSCAIVLVYQE